MSLLLNIKYFHILTVKCRSWLGRSFFIVFLDFYLLKSYFPVKPQEIEAREDTILANKTDPEFLYPICYALFSVPGMESALSLIDVGG